MVKKIIIIAVFLMLTFMPAAQANGVCASYQHNEFIEVTYELKFDEIAIGKPISFDVTINNLSQYNVELDCIHTNWITRIIGESDVSISDDKYCIGILKPYETVVLEIRNLEVFETLEWYKQGDEYYVDFKPKCVFLVDFDGRGSFSGANMYYDQMANAIPLEIANIYDGSDYFEFKWLDDEITMYCYNIPVQHERTGGEGFKPRTNGSVYYEAYLKNISSVEVSEIISRRDKEIIKPEEQKDFSGILSILNSTEDMDENQTCYFRKLFLIEGKYYAVEYERTYQVKYLEPPNIRIEAIPHKEDDQEYPSEVTLKAANISDSTIENFMISVFYFEDRDFTCVFETKDLESDEVLELVHDKYNHGIEYIGIGYFIDGIFHYWTLDEGSYYYIYHDYVSAEADMDDYELWYKKISNIAEVLKKPEEEQTPTPVITPPPTNAPTLTPTDTAVIESTPTVTVVKRQNLLKTLLITIVALTFFAVVMITINIKKNNKEKSNDQS